MKRKAVMLTRDTGRENVEIWDAILGIRKSRGCAWFRSVSLGQQRLQDISMAMCTEIFGFVPACGRAYYVEPTKTGWKRTRIDTKMAFSTGADWVSKKVNPNDILWL